MRRILLATAAGLLIAVGSAAPASAGLTAQYTPAEPPALAIPDGAVLSAQEECEIDEPTWQVEWTDPDAVTLRECGGEGGWSEAGTADGGQLPVTGWATGAAIGAAIALVGMGVGFYLLYPRRRMTFTA
jgi:hypothetical protein